MQRFLLSFALAACAPAFVGAAAFAQDAAVQKPAADAKPDAAAKAEPIRVPDGSPAELLEFVDKIQKEAPASRERAEVMEHLRKVCTAVVAAVDKIGERGSEDEQRRAITEKLEALQLLRRLQVEGSDKQMREYLTKLSEDKRAFVPPLAKVYYLATRLGEVDRGDHAALEKLADEVREHVKTAKLDAPISASLIKRRRFSNAPG
ncbi:MAG: hypothetical protein QM775_28935 [Pirellulales bacterium]